MAEVLNLVLSCTLGSSQLPGIPAPRIQWSSGVRTHTDIHNTHVLIIETHL